MRRAKWGIGAVAVVGLAWLLSFLFDIDLGGIGTDGARIGLPTASERQTPVDPPLQTEPATEPVAALADGDALSDGETLEVLIDDREYFLRRGKGEPADWVAADLDASAAYARQASGDDAGIRVRVFRKPSAKASAEQELTESLQTAGLTKAEIDVPERLVE